MFRKHCHQHTDNIVSVTRPLLSGCPCHVTDRCGGVFGRFWGVAGGGGGGGCCCFYPRLTPSFCPPDGCQLECSVTWLFLEGAAWNTPTKASLRINTSCSRAVWHVKTWVWFEAWVWAGIFSFFFTEKTRFGCPSFPASLHHPVFAFVTVSSNLPKVPKDLEMSPEHRGAGLRYGWSCVCSDEEQ